MTIKYLKNAKNLTELKKEYVKQLKQLHPDNGGTVQECQSLNAEYEYLRARLPKERPADAPETEAEKKADASLDKEIREMLAKIIRFPDLNIEIVGTWIWIDGLTFPVKDELKAAGFVWSKARRKWHATPYDTPKYYKGKKKSFEALRKRYGSDIVDPDPAPALA